MDTIQELEEHLEKNCYSFPELSILLNVTMF